MIYRIIQRLAEAAWASSISDDLPELLQNCDRILVMKQGRIAANFEAEQTSEDSSTTPC